MNPLLKKLNFKNQATITVLNSPTEFDAQLADFQYFTNIKKALDTEPLSFVLAFVTKQTEIDDLVPQIAERMKKDELFWFAYPKQSSKRYQCEFNRDNGWAILGKFGFEPVRMVAIDEDWSAIRFRRIEFIKNFTRNAQWAMTEQGKERGNQSVSSENI